MEQTLRINMLGEFSLGCADAKVFGDNRSRKVWMLLAYLAYYRERAVSQEELIRVLWGSEEEKEDPGSVLKATVWRVRRTLAPLGETLSKHLILRERDGYKWNASFPTEVDREIFESLFRRGKETADTDARIALYREALGLYRGSFLGKLSIEPWAAPVAAYYQAMYIEILQEYLPLLLEQQRFEETEALCRSAIQTEPYHEGLYRSLMRSMMGRGQFRNAAEVYTSLRETLFSDLGISPEASTQELYQECVRNNSGYMLTMEAIQEQLQKKVASESVICEYELFRQFYRAEANVMNRYGDAIHIGILSVTDSEGQELPQRSLERAMENLGLQIQNILRKSDHAARCSPAQYAILLLRANYENSCMVCDRIARAFARAFPHSPAKIHFSVLPLEQSNDRTTTA